MTTNSTYIYTNLFTLKRLLLPRSAMSVRPIIRGTSSACAALRSTAPRSWLQLRSGERGNSIRRGVSTKTAEIQQRVKKLPRESTELYRAIIANSSSPTAAGRPSSRCGPSHIRNHRVSKYIAAYFYNPGHKPSVWSQTADSLGNCRRRTGKSTLST